MNDGAPPAPVAVRADATRDVTASAAEWRRLVRLATGIDVAADANACTVPVEGGCVTLRWQPLPPLALGLIRLERLRVHAAFSPDVSPQARLTFWHHFDLHTRRGGG
ncbi:hypothetical protein [Tepidimonas aquatica]|uniref:Uncharacterized protein n=1 Tax=Tepidimonas aquatica TaxID=247482 RepID=A0A554WFA7_9BURK|nr:hypothetical protein [Tepidimonas aquatica]TSE22234.1 hypothetical protein Taqua_02140 [Tepidimonas aquatica]